MPVIHIQNSAPGPPMPMAVATPTMLPVPTVAARAVVKAWNWETSPSEPASLRLMIPRRSAGPSLTSWIRPNRIVRYSPVSSRSGIRTNGPQMTDEMSPNRVVRASMCWSSSDASVMFMTLVASR